MHQWHCTCTSSWQPLPVRVIFAGVRVKDVDMWVLAVYQQQLGGALVPKGPLQQATLGIQHQIKLALLNVERLCPDGAAVSAGNIDQLSSALLACLHCALCLNVSISHA